MEKLVAGDVVVIRFPFSDLTHTKKRPALVVATIQQDAVLCMITSKRHTTLYDELLDKKHFSIGSLHKQSTIRTHRIFTADATLVLQRVGRLTTNKHKAVQQKLIHLITTHS